MIPTIIINLKRSMDRKQQMIRKMKKANIAEFATFFEGVDGQLLATNPEKYRFKPMPQWRDPHTNIPLRIGEVGCGLSHYLVWKYIVENKIPKTLILEDDAIFYDGFREIVERIVESPLSYDMFYLHRWKISMRDERIVDDGHILPNNTIYEARYSHNASTYILTYEGARKLIQSPYLENMIPVDLFFSILHDPDFPFPQYTTGFEGSTRIRALALENDIANQEPRVDLPSLIEGTACIIQSFTATLYKGRPLE